jgi:lycopene cyclase domain-containing protein
MDRFQYLLVLAGCVLVTLPLEVAFGARVWRRPRRLLRAVLPAFAAFVAWDLWATARGTWSFSDRYTIGVELPGGLVIEELLFFLLIPVCALLTIESVRNILEGRVPWVNRLVRRATRAAVSDEAAVGDEVAA